MTRRLALVAVLLVAVLLAGCQQAPPARPQPLTVLCWNMHHGRGLDGVVDLERIADEIRALDPDVVALQEVDRGTARTDRIDMPAKLGALLGMEAHFGHNLDFQGGQYGNALLTHLPVRWARNDRYAMLREGEQRGLLRVGLNATDGRDFEVWVTHLDYRPDPSERLLNAAEIRAAVERTSAPLILTGDFNANPDGPTARALGAPFDDAWVTVHGRDGSNPGPTYPATGASKRIDWILFTPDRGLDPERVQIIPTAASDHRPLTARFRWADAP